MNTYYNNFKDRQEAIKQNEVKRERSFGEQMYPVSIAGNIAKFIIHVLSFCGGVILPAYGFDLLFGSFYIGLALGFAMVLVFIELPKWAVINTISENYYDSKIISYGLSMFALCIVVPSIINSTYGVEIAVKWLSPNAEIISIEDIESKYSKLADDAKAHWMPQSEKHSKEKVQYFATYKKFYIKENKYRLPSNKQRNWERMDKAEKEATNKLNSRLDSIQSQLQKAVSLAIVTNNNRTESHNFKKDNAGTIAFWCMAFLECCYVLIVLGLGYIGYRSEQEQIGVVPNETESNKIRPIQTESNQTNQKKTTEKQAVATRRIGYEQENQNEPNGMKPKEHGVTFTPIGSTTERVWYLNRYGDLVPKTKANLLKLLNRDGGTDSNKAELKRLIELFETVKQK
jgi:hypothetical protein